MNKRTAYYLLGGIFILTLAIRLYYAYQTPYFTDDGAYFVIRQVENIRNTGLPLYRDPLSFGGRTLLFNPIYYYILAFFNLFMPLSAVGKIIPNLFASCLVFITYLIALDLSKNQKIALFTSFISSFVPVFFGNTFNNLSIYNLGIPLIFFMLYCLIKVRNDKNYVSYFMISLFFLSHLHPSSLIFVIGLIFYYILVKVDKLKQDNAEFELIIFLVFFILWSQFIIYKKALLYYGLGAVWQNIPVQILSQYFSEITILGALYEIGFVPLIFGSYIIYKYVTKKKSSKMYMVIGFVLSVFLMLWLKLMPLEIGLIFLGYLLVLLFSRFLQNFFEYVQRTKFHYLESIILLFFIIILIFTSIIPSINIAKQNLEKSYTSSEIEALEWIEHNTNPNSTIVASSKEGHIINAVAKRKNVIDSKFFLIDNINTRFDDTKTIYKTFFETEALPLLNKYNIDYIYLSQKTKKEFNIKTIRYIKDSDCFNRVFVNKDVTVYKVLCSISE